MIKGEKEIGLSLESEAVSVLVITSDKELLLSDPADSGESSDEVSSFSLLGGSG